ncbi:MAG TPA: hypothetical protein VGX48_05320 [Pyrinomonadaceae bacterium]|jgi:hypothetical protein|nr:hypothetical protein [Pyrinomonadaceae bacterium]
MKNTKFSRSRGALAGLVAALAAFVLVSQPALAATWKGLEPFVSKRADVERVLGTPTADHFAEQGTLEFNVSGGKVTVFFVTPKFVAAKKLQPALEGSILQIVLQHERATDTPESMNLVKNSAYERQANGAIEVYTNAKDGIIYTFVESHLKTTRYSYSSAQFANIVAKGK